MLCRAISSSQRSCSWCLISCHTKATISLCQVSAIHTMLCPPGAYPVTICRAHKTSTPATCLLSITMTVAVCLLSAAWLVLARGGVIFSFWPVTAYSQQDISCPSTQMSMHLLSKGLLQSSILFPTFHKQAKHFLCLQEYSLRA